MYILGLGGSIHDFSACLVKDGNILLAIEEERLTRKKHAVYEEKFRGGRAADYCCLAEEISEGEIELAVCTDIMNFYYGAKYGDRLYMMNHHLSHAASAFYPSPFEEAAIFIADGRGSYLQTGIRETSSCYIGRSNQIELLYKRAGTETPDYHHVANSIGVFYHIVTQSIGFGFMHDGKTMGLAPFGTDRYLQSLAAFYSFDEEGQFVQSINQMRDMQSFIEQTLQASTSGELEQRKADFAYAVQYHLERIVIMGCQHLHRITGMKHLCLAGGVFLNSVANRKILEETPFEHIFIQPASGDAGTAIGCALYAWHTLLENKRTPSDVPFNPYLGKEYRKDEYSSAIARYIDDIKVDVPRDVYKATAALLQKGSIIGWFQGRSELGPRALGNRSILADARLPDMKDQINMRIKHREPFRPFAPVVPYEKQLDYFDMSHPSYYMLFVPNVKESRRKEIPSVTHIDGTGRVQSVDKALNPRLHQLLTSFYELTGTPVLLNTSFNDNNEPIVESPEDAIAAFLKLDLDYLIMNDMIIEKKNK